MGHHGAAPVSSGSPQGGRIGDVAGDEPQTLDEAAACAGVEVRGVAFEAGRHVGLEAGVVPVVACHADDVGTSREAAAFHELAEGGHEVAAGKVAGGAEDQEKGGSHGRAPSRARFMPEEMSPTWLNAWG